MAGRGEGDVGSARDRRDQEESGDRQADGAQAPRWWAWVIDGWVIGLLWLAISVAILVATVAPMLDRSQAEWVPYGIMRLVWIVLFLFVLYAIVAAAVLRLVKPSPGKRLARRLAGAESSLRGALMAGAGVALVGGYLFVLALLVQVVVALPHTMTAYEQARLLSAYVPPEAQAQPAAPEGGTRPEWFRAAEAEEVMFGPIAYHHWYVSREGAQGVHLFVTTYRNEALAPEAMVRLGATGATPIAGLGDEAFELADGAGIRMAVRDGATVLAGSAAASEAELLREVMAGLAPHMAEARDGTGRVFRLSSAFLRGQHWPTESETVGEM